MKKKLIASLALALLAVATARADEVPLAAACPNFEGTWEGVCSSPGKDAAPARVDVRQDGCEHFRMAYDGFMDAPSFEVAKRWYKFYSPEFWVRSSASQLYVVPFAPPQKPLVMSMTTIADWNEARTELTTVEYLIAAPVARKIEEPFHRQTYRYALRDSRLVRNSPDFEGECVYRRK